jgi:hypothetical protein
MRRIRTSLINHLLTDLPSRNYNRVSLHLRTELQQLLRRRPKDRSMTVIITGERCESVLPITSLALNHKSSTSWSQLVSLAWAKCSAERAASAAVPRFGMAVIRTGENNG